MSAPIRVILSLDMELAWGLQKLNESRLDTLKMDKSAGRNAVSFAIDALEEYDIPATWAIVGHLLLHSCSQDSHFRSPRIDDVDPYSDVERTPLYYAPDLVERIIASSTGHEIAGHSFSHPDFTELTRSETRLELKAMRQTFDQRDISVKTLVHPGIQIEHLDLLPEYGLTAYAESCSETGETFRSGIRRMFKLDGKFFTVPTVDPYVDEQGLVAVPRSRLLRDERWGWLNPSRLRHGITSAESGYIHLTFHPHNLVYDKFLRRNLTNILRILDKFRDRGMVEVVTIGELADQLR